MRENSQYLWIVYIFSSHLWALALNMRGTASKFPFSTGQILFSCRIESHSSLNNRFRHSIICGILFDKKRGFGRWKKETWKQFRAYSIQELKDEMKIYKQSKGNKNFHAYILYISNLVILKNVCMYVHVCMHVCNWTYCVAAVLFAAREKWK